MVPAAAVQYHSHRVRILLRVLPLAINIPLAMRGMLILMGFPQDATIIEEDNQACVYASEIPHLTRGMKHLDLAEMLIKEKVESNEIKLIKVASADNTSDLGTKRLALPLFNKLTSRIILINHSELIYKLFMFIFRNSCFKLQN